MEALKQDPVKYQDYLERIRRANLKCYQKKLKLKNENKSEAKDSFKSDQNEEQSFTQAARDDAEETVLTSELLVDNQIEN